MTTAAITTSFSTSGDSRLPSRKPFPRICWPEAVDAPFRPEKIVAQRLGHNLTVLDKIVEKLKKIGEIGEAFILVYEDARANFPLLDTLYDPEFGLLHDNYRDQINQNGPYSLTKIKAALMLVHLKYCFMADSLRAAGENEKAEMLEGSYAETTKCLLPLFVVLKDISAIYKNDFEDLDSEIVPEDILPLLILARENDSGSVAARADTPDYIKAWMAKSSSRSSPSSSEFSSSPLSVDFKSSSPSSSPTPQDSPPSTRKSTPPPVEFIRPAAQPKKEKPLRIPRNTDLRKLKKWIIANYGKEQFKAANLTRHAAVVKHDGTLVAPVPRHAKDTIKAGTAHSISQAIDASRVTNLPNDDV